MQVGIIMGSDSDYTVMKEAALVLTELEIVHEMFIISAHRTPCRMVEYAQTALERGLSVIVAGAGGAAHLPGMVASLTCLPVIGVPVKTKSMDGLDSLLSISQMPAGVPVATVPIDGGAAAGLLAAKILGIGNPDMQKKLTFYLQRLTAGEDVRNWLDSLSQAHAEDHAQKTWKERLTRG